MTLAALPARDPASRARLAEVSERARPVVLARDRALVLPAPLGDALGGLVRGSVVALDGRTGAGVTSVALALCAAATAAGEWAAAVDLDGTLSGEAAAAAGVALERFAVVRRVPPARWAAAAAVLLDGVSLVLVDVPTRARPDEARRLVARARERGVVLVPLVGPGARWPATASQRVHVEGGAWPGLGSGHGLLTGRASQVRVVGPGGAARERAGVLAS